MGHEIGDDELDALLARFDTMIWPTGDKRTSDRLVAALDGLDRDRVERLLDVMFEVREGRATMPRRRPGAEPRPRRAARSEPSSSAAARRAPTPDPGRHDV